MTTGIIFDIKEMALYDGPGIRTTVFFKGCPMHCTWCHNPEGLSPHPQLMTATNNCIHCGKCIAACPSQGSACTLCGKCISACPLHLRRICGVRQSAGVLARRLLKDDSYLRKYGGGVTFSGGEPTMQPAFLLELISLIPGMHKCLETCGYCSQDIFRSIIQKMDYIIMDLKLIDSQKHIFYTGVDNKRILKNLSFLKQSGKPFTIRIPVIPGVNDDEENYAATAGLLAGSLRLERVELLPYHATAGAKYPMAGLAYKPEFSVDRKPNLDTTAFTRLHIPCSHL